MEAVFFSGFLIQQIGCICYFNIIAVQVAGEDGFVELYMASVRVWCACAGVAAFEYYAVDKLECSFPVASTIRFN